MACQRGVHFRVLFGNESPPTVIKVGGNEDR
jgi:hypothetical protein